MKIELIYSDSEYSKAVNCTHTTFYNDPMSVVIDGKKFILPFGTSDEISKKVVGNGIYFVGKNRPLNYISIVYIEPKDETMQEHYFDDGILIDCDSLKGIFNKSLKKQIEILSAWL